MEKALALFQRDLQLQLHKAHLLCLLARGMLLSQQCDDPTLQSVVLSTLTGSAQQLGVPDEGSKFNKVILLKLLRWFCHESSHLSAAVKEVWSNVGGVSESQLLVSLFRSLGLRCRLVMVLHPLPMKSHVQGKGGGKGKGAGKKGKGSGKVKLENCNEDEDESSGKGETRGFGEKLLQYNMQRELLDGSDSRLSGANKLGRSRSVASGTSARGEEVEKKMGSGQSRKRKREVCTASCDVSSKYFVKDGGEGGKMEGSLSTEIEGSGSTDSEGYGSTKSFTDAKRSDARESKITGIKRSKITDAKRSKITEAKRSKITDAKRSKITDAERSKITEAKGSKITDTGESKIAKGKGSTRSGHRQREGVPLPRGLNARTPAASTKPKRVARLKKGQPPEYVFDEDSDSDDFVVAKKRQRPKLAEVIPSKKLRESMVGSKGQTATKSKPSAAPSSSSASSLSAHSSSLSLSTPSSSLSSPPTTMSPHIATKTKTAESAVIPSDEVEFLHAEDTGFWAEVLSPDLQRWCCVHPLSLSVDQPKLCEKHCTVPLHYVVAIENRVADNGATKCKCCVCRVIDLCRLCNRDWKHSHEQCCNSLLWMPT
jgi:hypothetical protein